MNKPTAKTAVSKEHCAFRFFCILGRPVLGYLQRADPFDQRAFERVPADRKIGKTHPSGPTQTDRHGLVDPFRAQMWERDGSARTSERSAHASARASPCPAQPHLAAALHRPIFSTAVLATLCCRFGLVPRAISGELMSFLAVCAGLECLAPR
jgi:hypothetical protein